MKTAMPLMPSITARELALRGGAMGSMAVSGEALPVPPKEEVQAAVAARGGEQKGGMMQTLKVGSFFFLWYLFNIGYNIYNKKCLNVLPLPWTVGLVQLSFGLIYVFALWLTGLRKVSPPAHIRTLHAM
jgi:hypothetical protein